MPTLELSREEASDLADALRSYLNDFHDEIVNTDDFDYKQALQQKRERLEAVVARLGGAGTHGPGTGLGGGEVVSPGGAGTHGPGTGLGGGEVVSPADGDIIVSPAREVPPSREGGASF
jgi:hypothetical protein